MKQKVIISTSLEQHLDDVIKAVCPDRLFLLCDATTAEVCFPKVKAFECLKDAGLIVIKAGDSNKNLDAIAGVWEALQKGGATRHSMMINIGGGMVTDLGGFAASTFKRGIHFVNIPTTLLSLVDASVGGKTGINFGGLKNEIGVFNTADVVILDTQFLDTLSNVEMRSGYAEMLKHGLICTSGDDSSHSRKRMWAELMDFDIAAPDLQQLQRMVAESVQVKEHIVEIDPLEHGLRKALNFGHTVGHAFESFGMACGKRLDGKQNSSVSPVPHGYAVAYGMVCELWLSCVKTGFPQDIMRSTVRFINDYYGKMMISCDDYETLFELMTHDKKNTAGTINFTLLSDIGGIEINQTATKEEIFEAFDFYREN
ncbi:3-dehydroquinate synthase [Palleniella muris]|uniref:3-dehydroquinate synthase n=1 Tax=Palleniella muris TaxID=3038145 RepID=A0AC61QQZ7_9BACT|nr:3-dehydroquinate synthase family protein [Palleniella muris]TGX82699.1 3-dehydroquinate synthase [Palleniella muris]